MEIGLISASEVCELPGEISCSHLFRGVDEIERHLQVLKSEYLNSPPGFILK